TDNVLVDPAAPALEDLAVLVDEKVVADVVPAVREHVVALDAAHDGGRVRSGVGVRPGGVVDDGKADGVRVIRRPAYDRLVRAPGRARDDRGRVRARQRPESRERRAPEEVPPQPGHTAHGPVLHVASRPGPERVADLPALARGSFGRARIGEVL